MTDTQTQTQQTSTPAAPAFDPVMGGDAFSEAERAYFESGGEKIDGLAGGEQQTTQETVPNGNGNGQHTTQQAATTQQTGTEPPADAVDGEVEVLADGKVRDLKTGRFVPHKAFHAERERRKAVESELAQTRERFTRADERLAVLNEALKGNVAPANTQQEDAPPDPEKDIFGAFKWATKRIAELEGKVNKTGEETRVQLAKSALRQHYEGDVARYAKTNPNFEAAKAHLVEGRHKELEAVGYADKAERQAIIDRQEAELAIQAYRSKRSAAEMLYNLALARGFAPPSQQTQAQTNGAGTQQQQSEAAAKLDAIAKGQQAAASLTNAAGGAAGELTLEALANMNDAEFDAALRKIGGQAALRKMLGG